MKLLLSVLIIFAFCFHCFSQEIPLTNANIVELIKAGISEDVILAKIKSSKANFDTSSNALIELKKAGTSDKVILAIVEQTKATETPMKTDTNSRKVKSIEEIQKQISEFADSKYFSVKYDKFKDLTSLSVRLDLTTKGNKPFDSLNSNSFNLFIGSTFKGNGIKENADLHLLCSASTSSSWKFLNNRGLILIVDSNRISLGEGTHNGDINFNSITSTSSVSEFLCWTLNEQQLLTILTAQKIEFQLGEVESVIEKEKLLLFRLFQKLLLPTENATQTENNQSLSVRDAIGKRKVYIETSDKQSELEIAKELKKKTFEIVPEIGSAEIVIRFGVGETDTFTLGQISTERSWGKISIYLRISGKESLIFTKSKKPSTFGQLLHKQAGDLTEDFIKALLKLENPK